MPSFDWGQEQNYEVEQLGSCSVPFMVIQSTAFMDLVGLKSDLACHMVDAERAMALAPHPKNRSFYICNFSPAR